MKWNEAVSRIRTFQCMFTDMDDFNPILVVRARKPVSWERIIAPFINFGSHMHCEYIVMDPSSPQGSLFAYSIFSGENMSFRVHTLNNPLIADDDIWDNVRIRITGAEAVSMQKYLLKLCGKEPPIAYNMSDSRMLLPFVNPRANNVFITDVSCDLDSEDAPQKVFCSQIGVLLLKQCIESNDSLKKTIAKYNSRVTSPETLLQILLDNGGEIVGGDVLRGYLCSMVNAIEIGTKCNKKSLPDSINGPGSKKK